MTRIEKTQALLKALAFQGVTPKNAANDLKVAVSTVYAWIGGRMEPSDFNYSKLHDFAETHNIVGFSGAIKVCKKYS